MRTWAATVVVFVGLFAGGSVLANPAVLDCVNCTPAQMQNMARQQAPGTWDVWNPRNGDIRRFRVYCGTEVPQGTGPGQTDASQVDPTRSKKAGQLDVGCTQKGSEQLALDSDREGMAHHLSILYNATNGSYKTEFVVRASHLTIGSGNYDTAHTYLTDANLRAQYNDMVTQFFIQASTNPVQNSVAYVFAHAIAFAGFTGQVEVLATLEFVDGSKVKLLLQVNRLAEYLAGSGRDSEGNLLPDSAGPNNQGRWRFSEQNNQIRFRELMGRHGAILVGGGSSWRPLEQWDCVFDWTNNRLTCTRIYTP